jgi:hypothetical protein
MNRKRTLSIVVLAALLLTQAMPASAGGMLCPMKEEARVQAACTGCEAGRGDGRDAGHPFRVPPCCFLGAAASPDRSDLAARDGCAGRSRPRHGLVGASRRDAARIDIPHHRSPELIPTSL